MTLSTRGAGLLLGLLLLPASALAQDGFAGRYELEGRYSNRRMTAVDIQISQSHVGGPLVVSRTGRYTSRRHRDKPAFTWVSAATRARGRVLEVTYRLDAVANADGIIHRLNPDEAERDDILRALTATNTFKAVYLLSQDTQELRELVVNHSRFGAESWWRWVSTAGTRKAPETSTELSESEFEARAHGTIKDWYLNDVRETYADLLADAETEAEREELREDMAIDLDFDNCEFMEDEYWLDDIRYRYDDDEPYLDADGQAIPFASIEVISLSMFPEYAGIGLSKTFVFDRRTGELIDEGDIMD